MNQTALWVQTNAPKYTPIIRKKLERLLPRSYKMHLLEDHIQDFWVRVIEQDSLARTDSKPAPKQLAIWVFRLAVTYMRRWSQDASLRASRGALPENSDYSQDTGILCTYEEYGSLPWEPQVPETKVSGDLISKELLQIILRGSSEKWPEYSEAYAYLLNGLWVGKTVTQISQEMGENRSTVSNHVVKLRAYHRKFISQEDIFGSKPDQGPPPKKKSLQKESRKPTTPQKKKKRVMVMSAPEVHNALQPNDIFDDVLLAIATLTEFSPGGEITSDAVIRMVCREHNLDPEERKNRRLIMCAFRNQKEGYRKERTATCKSSRRGMWGLTRIGLHRADYLDKQKEEKLMAQQEKWEKEVRTTKEKEDKDKSCPISRIPSENEIVEVHYFKVDKKTFSRREDACRYLRIKQWVGDVFPAKEHLLPQNVIEALIHHHTDLIALLGDNPVKP